MSITVKQYVCLFSYFFVIYSFFHYPVSRPSVIHQFEHAKVIHFSQNLKDVDVNRLLLGPLRF